MVTHGVARRLIAATAVTFTALAALLASGVTISVARTAPLALTAPLDPTAAAVPSFAGVAVHAGDLALDAPSAVGPQEAAPCVCVEQAGQRIDQAAERVRTASPAHVIARAPPGQG